MKPLALATTLAVLAHGAAADPASEIRMLGNCAGCVLDGGDFSQTRLMGLDVTEADLDGVSFEGASMSVAVLNGARLTNVRFDGADLRGATFVDARLSNVSFEGADLTGAVFEGATLAETDLATARLCKTQMPDDEMANRDCGD